jgi:hypothetical protein
VVIGLDAELDTLTFSDKKGIGPETMILPEKHG